MLLMVYLLNRNKLPWSDFNKRFKQRGYQFIDFLKERLDIKYVNMLFRYVTPDIVVLLKMVLSLKFE